MKKDEAKHLIRFHSFSLSQDDSDYDGMDRGFIGMLRPFNGSLEENNFREIMEAIRTLEDEFRKETIERYLLNDLWCICFTLRYWGINEDGMLRRNNLITSEQIEVLNEWLDIISLTVSALLDGAATSEAFNEYENYLNHAQRTRRSANDG